MYKSSPNYIKKNIDDYLFEEDFIIEKEFKCGDERYKIPPKKSFNFNILGITQSCESNKKDLLCIPNQVNNLDKNNQDSKTIFNDTPFSSNSPKIQIALIRNSITNKNTVSLNCYNRTDINNQVLQEQNKIEDIQTEIDKINSIFSLHKLVFDKNLQEISKLLNKFKDKCKSIVNSPDLRGNSPLLLAITLKNHYNDIGFLPIIRELLEHKGDTNYHNSFSISPLEEAVSKNDTESIVLIMEEMFLRKIKKINTSREKLSQFLINSSDFYLEMKWNFDSFIPLISKIAPSDTCRIWKKGEKLRMDTTFDDFKNLKTKRTSLTYLLTKNKDSSEVLKLNNDEKIYFEPFEPFDDEEKMMIINDILNQQKLKGEFKIKECTIVESKSLLGNFLFETINGWRAKKYDVEISASVKIDNRYRLDYNALDKNSYFDEKSSLLFNKKLISNENEVKKNSLINDLNIQNKLIPNDLKNIGKEKEKKLKASIWITENFPIKSSYLMNIVNSFSSANGLLLKIKEFLNQESIKSILKKNGFPIKIRIPIKFYLDIEILFGKVHEIVYEVGKDKLFEIPKDYKKVSRKIGENLKENHKKRLIYANFAI